MWRKYISDNSEPVKIELRAYIEYWEVLSMNKYDQIFRNCFLCKYVGLSIYDIDMEKRYSIDDKEIKFVKGDGYALIGNPDNPDGTSTDYEYYCIHEDLFERILETGQNSDITLKVITNRHHFHRLMSKYFIQDQRRILCHKWLHLPFSSRGNARKKIMIIPKNQSMISS